MGVLRCSSFVVRKESGIGPVAAMLAAVLVAGCDEGNAIPADAVDDEADAEEEAETGADGDADADADGDADADADADADGDGDADGDADADADGDDGGDAAWTNTLAVLTSDYATGGLALVDLDTVGTTTPAVVTDAAAVHSDAVLLCRGGGTLDVLERAGSDRLRRFQIADGVATAGASLDLPDGGNPQDAQTVRTETSAYLAVPLYEQPTMEIVDFDLGEIATSVDLSPFADATDGLPEAAHAVAVGTSLFVSLQLLDRSGMDWTPTGPGVLAVFDATSFAPVDLDPGTPGPQGATLTGRNPWGPMRAFGPAILVSSVGAYGADDGGIEAFDPSTATTHGFVVTEATLGGDIGDWLVFEDDTGVAIVTVGSAEDRVVAFDIDSGTTVGGPLLTSAGYTLSGLVDLGDGRFAVGDRTAGVAGLRVFDSATGEEATASPIPVGLPPVMACVAN